MNKALSLVKIGGALVSQKGAPDGFWRSVADLYRDRGVVLVHGGGSHATRVARMIGHEPTFVHGRRVTGDLDLEIVQWTMRGAVNVRLVAQAIHFGIRAVGLSGADGQTVQVHRRPLREIDGRQVDFGWVGDIDAVDTTILNLLVDNEILPVVAPMGIDKNGLLYNVNADTVAVHLAVGLGATELALVTESGGVREDPQDPRTVRKTIDAETFAEGVRAGWITGGMRAKLENVMLANKRGVPVVRVVGADQLADTGAGTQMVAT